jgi:hypothetical protein
MIAVSQSLLDNSNHEQRRQIDEFASLLMAHLAFCRFATLARCFFKWAEAAADRRLLSGPYSAQSASAAALESLEGRIEELQAIRCRFHAKNVDYESRATVVTRKCLASCASLGTAKGLWFGSMPDGLSISCALRQGLLASPT